ncbi:MAG: CPBP family intramembrane metalloprotease [Bacteroidetes bacterium]|nr:CPBP family intramembrane metalloprotease [Bacteroidota bacterium]
MFLVEPEELYSIFVDSNYKGAALENLGYQVLAFTFIMALFALMSMFRVKPTILLSNSGSIGRSMLVGVGIFFLFRFISGIYVSVGTKVFNVSIDDIAVISKMLLATKQDIEAIINTFGKTSTILLVGFLVPVYEEVIFRGVILDSCQRHINFKSANTFQSLLLLFCTEVCSCFLILFIWCISR